MSVSGNALCSRPDASGFAVTYSNFGRLELRDSTGVLGMRVQTPFASEPEFTRSPTTGRLQFRQERDYYRGCAFSGNHLFALFSGRREADFRAGQYEYAEASFVHVFDMRGRLVRVLDLGVGVLMFALDGTGRTMYGTSWSTGQVYRFALPAIQP
jgi:hypothetical protein